MPLMLLQLGVVVLLQNYLIYHTPAASDKSLQRFYWTLWHLLTCIHCSKMAVTNFTKDINQKEIEELLCSSQMNITGEVHNQLIFLSVLNTFLSSTAILGNTLILVALRRDFSIGSPSKLLYRSLAITDYLRQLPLANGTTFSKISKTEINLESYSQIFERIFPEVFFPFHFAPGIARIVGWKVRVSEIQQFPECQETFRGNFCTTCHCFQFFNSLRIQPFLLAPRC